MNRTMHRLIAAALLLPGMALAAGVTIDPAFQSFGQSLLGAPSAAQTLTVRNQGTASVTLGSGTLDGDAAGDFMISNDFCSGQTLAAGANCTVQVRFVPQAVGARAATWSVALSGAESGTLSAFLANYEDVAFEARRRIPPVMSSLTLPASVKAGTATDIVWALEGYHEGYQAMVVLFDCQGVASDCGASYGEATRFAESGLLTPEATGAGVWSYSGNTTLSHRFRYSFTPDPVRFSSGGQVVARFYYVGSGDTDKSSLSLLVPGGLPGVSYYDAEGRRLELTVTP